MARSSRAMTFREFRLSQHSADDAGGVVDHGDDFAVVDAGGADDADGADDAVLGVAGGGDHHRDAGGAEQAGFRADENAHAVGGLGQVQQAEHGLLGLQPLEQGLDVAEFFELVDIGEQAALAAQIREPARPSVDQVARPASMTLLVSASRAVRSAPISAATRLRSSESERPESWAFR